MFKLVSGNNGRTVYTGKTTRSNEKAVSVVGQDWDTDSKQMMQYQLDLFVGKDMLADRLKGINRNMGIGQTIICAVLPDRKNPNIGVAEEIAHKGQVIKITNDHNNVKYCIYGTVRCKKWNDNHTLLRLSFLNLTDMDGNLVGYESIYEDNQTGETRSSHWLNVNYFNSAKFGHNAAYIDKNINVGDTVILVATEKTSEYQGKTYTNYNGAKFFVVEKAPQNINQRQNTPADNVAETSATQSMSTSHLDSQAQKNVPRTTTPTSEKGLLQFESLSPDLPID